MTSRSDDVADDEDDDDKAQRLNLDQDSASDEDVENAASSDKFPSRRVGQ